MLPAGAAACADPCFCVIGSPISSHLRISTFQSAFPSPYFRCFLCITFYAGYVVLLSLVNWYTPPSILEITVDETKLCNVVIASSGQRAQREMQKFYVYHI